MVRFSPAVRTFAAVILVAALLTAFLGFATDHPALWAVLTAVCLLSICFESRLLPAGVPLADPDSIGGAPSSPRAPPSL